MKCIATISGAGGEWDIEEVPLPDAFTDACNLWVDAQDAETGIKILGMLKPFLKANFIPINLENPSDIIPGDPEEEYDALEVIPLAFEYSGDPWTLWIVISGSILHELKNTTIIKTRYFFIP